VKSLLVTGGAGFIGSNFIRYLLGSSGYAGRVINVDKLTYAGNLENLRGIEAEFGGRYAFVQADICDSVAIEAAILEHGVDAIVHFAAESHVDRSIVAPEDFLQTNIVGTFRLLELFRKHRDRLELFHHVSTDEVFGSLGPEGLFTEATPYHPNSPYSASKAASDHLVRAYGHTYGLPFTISNCSNNYGPYQFPEKLIPLMIVNALAGKPLPIYGDGKNVRDWLYVRDHAAAIWAIMTRGRKGETYNIGGGAERSNLEVVRLLCSTLDRLQPSANGAYAKRMQFVTDRPGHDRRYAMNFSKLKEELGWAPEESFETGVSKTIKWYLVNLDWVRRVQSGEYREWMRRQYGI
jgi:dTDP-glucose 4,6-dehydratase